MSPAGPAGVTWSETFKGWLAFGHTDFNQAMLPEHREPVTAGLTVAVGDIERFLAAQADGGIRDAEALPAAVTRGYVRCDAFGGELIVRNGTFQAFVPAGQSRAARCPSPAHALRPGAPGAGWPALRAGGVQAGGERPGL